MIKVGFICEGHTEKILLESAAFGHLLAKLKIEPLQVINAEGCDNLLPHNIVSYITILEEAGAQVIVILTDLDDDVCITKTINRISARPQNITVVAVKKIEAWFLACTPAMQRMLGQTDFSFPNPEGEKEPFETINGLLTAQFGRGIGKKTRGRKN